VTTAELARDMSLWAPFNAEEFLRVHPQWNWQEGYLQSRPHQPWTMFDGATED
jgi:hypothetical protein